MRQYADHWNVLLLLTRVLVAGVLFHHAGIAVVRDECGNPVAVSMGSSGRWVMPLTVGAEVTGATLLGLGLLTPFGAASVLAITIGTYVTMRGRTGPWLGVPRWEWMLGGLAAASLALAVAGPGEWSVDYRNDWIHDLDGATGLGIAILVGLAVEGLWLGAGWYPSRRSYADGQPAGCWSWLGIAGPPTLLVALTVVIALIAIDTTPSLDGDLVVSGSGSGLLEGGTDKVSPLDDLADAADSGDASGGTDKVSPLPEDATAEQYLEYRLRDLPPIATYVVMATLRAGMPPEGLAFGFSFSSDDNILDWVYSILFEIPGRQDPMVDQIRVILVLMLFNIAALQEMFGTTVFECGATEQMRTTACSDMVLPMPEGEVVMVNMQLDAPPTGLAGGTNDQFVYAFVAETDGDPANDWQFNPPFDGDFFIGSDTWFELHIDGSTGAARVVKTDAGTLTPQPTATRAVVLGDSVTFFIPVSELGGDAHGFSWRTSSFVHDGTFQIGVSGGDVIGADASEPLRTVPSDAPVFEVTLETIATGNEIADQLLSGELALGEE